MVLPFNELPLYYRYVRQDIISAIPAGALNILDIGCAAGMLGKVLKEQNPNRRVVGIELNDEAFCHAKINLDEAIHGNIEEFEPPFHPGQFDCIVCADVLEHLKDPWRIAWRYATFLKPGGVMVASIPNIRHLPTLRQIAEFGSWEYQEAGILDRTHLRFFTKKTFLELLQQANIVCESITYLGGEELHRLRFQQENNMVRFGNFVLLDVPDEDFYELCTYQFLFVGTYQPVVGAGLGKTLDTTEQNSAQNPPRKELKPRIIIRTKNLTINASVIVPWWDHTDLLEVWERNMTHLKDAEVIFIDNGSAPTGKGALEAFTQRHKIKLIRNEENRGYAAANNQGAAIATGEYFLFLNNDVEIFSPPVQYLCQLAGEGISDPGPLRAVTGERCVEGWGLCIKKQTFQTIGKWCEDYSLGYADDVDLCYRAKLAGYSLTYAKELVSDNSVYLKETDRPMKLLMRHLGMTTSRDGRIDQRALSAKNHARLTKKFYPYLREINLIIFPDWHQPEEKISQELAQVIKRILTHPAQDKLSLLIDTSNVDEEEANLVISGLVMEILMEEDLEIDEEEGASIYVLGKPWEIEWDPILYRLHARIVLEHENQLAIANTKTDKIPCYQIEEIKNKLVVQLETGNWSFKE